MSETVKNGPLLTCILSITVGAIAGAVIFVLANAEILAAVLHTTNGPSLTLPLRAGYGVMAGAVLGLLVGLILTPSKEPNYVDIAAPIDLKREARNLWIFVSVLHAFSIAVIGAIVAVTVHLPKVDAGEIFLLLIVGTFTCGVGAVAMPGDSRYVFFAWLATLWLVAFWCMFASLGAMR